MTKNDLVCEYTFESKLSAADAASKLAGESSIGTWTKISTMKPAIAKKLAPHVFFIDNRTKTVKIAYPKELFEEGNMPQILSSIAGNIFGMNAVDNLRLEDIDFPSSIIKSFNGPKFGINGIRKFMSVKNRPLVGTIVKPKVGLNETEHAKVAFDSWVGGCDVVKDDENLTSMKFNNFEDRVIKTLEARDRAQDETGEKKAYMPNVTAESNEMVKRAEFVKEHGGRYAMIDIITTGFSGLQTLREADLDLALHAHRAMYAALSRNPKHGVSMLVLAKIARMIGVDQLHIGTVIGKMHGSAQEVKSIEDAIEKQKIPAEPKVSNHVLGQNWGKTNNVFAVSSGGLHPGHIPKLIKLMGTDVIIQLGGGIHGHPNGTVAGAKAARDAIDASVKGVSLKEAAKQSKELDEVIKKWGVV